MGFSGFRGGRAALLDNSRPNTNHAVCVVLVVVVCVAVAKVDVPRVVYVVGVGRRRPEKCLTQIPTRDYSLRFNQGEDTQPPMHTLLILTKQTLAKPKELVLRTKIFEAEQSPSIKIFVATLMGFVRVAAKMKMAKNPRLMTIPVMR